jgi:hypothetical protein
MYPFEVFDERTQRIEFYYNKFGEYKTELFRQYPARTNHSRLEIDLLFPSERLEDVFCHDWNPHGRFPETAHLDRRHCFYNNSNWSTIFEVYPMHSRSTEQLKCFVEFGHQDPWGEKITLMSTATSIYDNHSFRFAFFRQKYWKVNSVISHNRIQTFFEDFISWQGMLQFPDIRNIRSSGRELRTVAANRQTITHDRIEIDMNDFLWDGGGVLSPMKKIDANWQKEGF